MFLQTLLEVLVNHENWLQMVNIFPLSSLSENVDSWRNVSAAMDFGQFSVDFESEAAEFFDIDRLSISDVFVDILDQTFPNNQHLGFGLQGFEI